jgi:hypothetical protein
MKTMNLSQNSSTRKSLSNQLDRLDSILDGLAEGLQEAIATAVHTAVREAVAAVLTSAEERGLSLAKATVAETTATKTGEASTFLRRVVKRGRQWIGHVFATMHRFARQGWETVCEFAFVTWLVIGPIARLGQAGAKAAWLCRATVLSAAAAATVVGGASYLAGPLISAIVCGLAGAACWLAGRVVLAISGGFSAVKAMLPIRENI